MNTESSLVIFTQGAKLLAEADTIQKARELKNLALTAAEWARRWNKGKETIAYCRSYAYDAERRMGEMLKETPKATGTRNQLSGKNSSGGAKLEPPEDDIPTLEELGVSKRESAQAQKLVEMPVEVFERLKSGEISRYKAAHVGHNSGDNEWYTPSEYIEAVRKRYSASLGIGA